MMTIVEHFWTTCDAEARFVLEQFCEGLQLKVILYVFPVFHMKPDSPLSNEAGDMLIIKNLFDFPDIIILKNEMKDLVFMEVCAKPIIANQIWKRSY